MSARVFENPHIGLKPILFFDIEIPLEPFEFDGETQETAVELCFIEFAVPDWRQLEGREYAFPVNPEPGYIDGSLYLGGAYNPADTTRIRFGQLDGDSIHAEFDIVFDFEYEGPTELGQVEVRWALPLSIDAQQLDEAVAEAKSVGAIGS
jgi:hypothetical protein